MNTLYLWSQFTSFNLILMDRSPVQWSPYLHSLLSLTSLRGREPHWQVMWMGGKGYITIFYNVCKCQQYSRSSDINLFDLCDIKTWMAEWQYLDLGGPTGLLIHLQSFLLFHLLFPLSLSYIHPFHPCLHSYQHSFIVYINPSIIHLSLKPSKPIHPTVPPSHLISSIHLSSDTGSLCRWRGGWERASYNAM